MFSGYRRGDANEPDGYVASVALVLSAYDSEVIIEATDPRTGVQNVYKDYMPNSGQVKAFCDVILARRKPSRYAGLPPFKRIERPYVEPTQGDLARIFVAQSHQRYQEMLDNSQKPDVNNREFKFGQSIDGLRNGIWVSIVWI